MPELDQAVAAAVTVRLIAAAEAIWADSSIAPGAKLDAFGEVVRGLVEPLSAVRQIAPAVLAETSPEAVQARALARAAEQKRLADLQRAREEAVGRVVTEKAARVDVEKARQGVVEAEEVLAAYSGESAPRRERVLAKGAVESARRDLAAAEAKLADVLAKAKGAP